MTETARQTLDEQRFLRIKRPPALVTQAEAEEVMRNFYLVAERLGHEVERVGESNVIWHPELSEFERESLRRGWRDAPLN
ncbi:MAG: hypothetical protein R2725_07625 [Solirubrobacterales bacterium]